MIYRNCFETYEQINLKCLCTKYVKNVFPGNVRKTCLKKMSSVSRPNSQILQFFKAFKFSGGKSGGKSGKP